METSRILRAATRAQTHKLLWGNYHVNSEDAKRHAEIALAAQRELATLDASSMDEVAAKLAELLDMMRETATPSQIGLLRKIVQDVDRIADRQPVDQPLQPTTPAHRCDRPDHYQVWAWADSETPEVGPRCNTIDGARRQASRFGAKAKRGRLGSQPVGIEIHAFDCDGVHLALVEQASQPQTERVPKVKVDRRARPVMVDGETFPSMTAAARALNIAPRDLRTSRN